MFNNTDKHHEAKGYTCEKRLLLQVKEPRLSIEPIHLLASMVYQLTGIHAYYLLTVVHSSFTVVTSFTVVETP